MKDVINPGPLIINTPYFEVIGFNETRDVNRKSKVDMETGTRCDLHDDTTLPLIFGFFGFQ